MHRSSTSRPSRRGRAVTRPTAKTEPRPKGRRVQTPGPFEYERATSIEGALATLERVGAGARVIAGGPSLLPMMKLRLASPELLVDINDLSELDYIRDEGSELVIGALTRHRELLE